MATTTTLGRTNATAPVNDPGSLAHEFSALSQALDNFRVSHWAELTADQRGQLKDQAQALDDRAHQLTAVAVGDLIQTIQPQLGAISDAASDAKKALGNLNKVGNAVAIATAAVALGAAVATGNLASVSTAVGKLSDTVAAAKK